jgi:hypothetical protein
MTIPPELLPVIQITLPLILAIFGASWIQNRRLDEISKRIDDIVGWLNRIERRLESMDAKLSEHGERLTRVEERLPPPLVRR